MNNTLMIINILSVTYYTFTGIVFIFILLGIIGKFGLFPLNLGIFGIVDGVSLFTSMVVLLLNKFIYVIIVDYLPLGRLGNYVINDITFTCILGQAELQHRGNDGYSYRGGQAA